VTVRLWQLAVALGVAIFMVGLLAGRYAFPNDRVNTTGREFEHHLNDAFKARRGDVAAQQRIAARDTSTIVGPPATDRSTAGGADDVRAVIPALEAWYADHNSYAGASADLLRSEYDAGVPDVEIVVAGDTTYCVQSLGDQPYHKAGPAADILPGPC
jgi:hypothetical protein